MCEKRHFHLWAVPILWFQSLKRYFYLFIFLFVHSGFRGESSWIGYGIFFVVFGIFAVIRYLSAYYAVTPEKIIIYKGILRKSEIDISYERIQTIKQTQWFFFKPFQITRLVIETAGGSSNKAEAILPAVPESILAVIESYRKKECLFAQDGLSEELAVQHSTYATKESIASNVTYQVTNQEIILFGLTDLGILVSTFALLTVVKDSVSLTLLEQSATLIQTSLVVGVALVLGILLLIILFSLFKSFIHYYKFQVTREGNTFIVESGLLERRVQKIPIEKIQGIKISQQLFRRLFRLYSVELLIAGGQEKSEETSSNKNIYLVPILSRKMLFEVLGALLPEWRFSQPEFQYTSQGYLWYFCRWFVLLGIVGTAVAGYFNSMIGLILGILVGIVLGSKWIESRQQGYQIQRNQQLWIQKVTLTTRYFFIFQQKKVQSFTESSSYWLHKKSIGHLSVTIKKGNGRSSIHLPFIHRTDIEVIKQFLLSQTK